jgi:hypothetical protein
MKDWSEFVLVRFSVKSHPQGNVLPVSRWYLP